jgi:hypothetical protein
MKFIIGLIVLPIAGMVLTLPIVAYMAASPLAEVPKPADYNSTRITTIIGETEAEKASRDALDESYQRSGYEKGAVRGGALGSTALIYVGKDGTNFAVDKDDGTLGDKMPHSLDNTQPDHYYWKVVLNFENTTKPEYDFVVDANTGRVLQRGVTD